MDFTGKIINVWMKENNFFNSQLTNFTHKCKYCNQQKKQQILKTDNCFAFNIGSMQYFLLDWFSLTANVIAICSL